MFVSSGRWVNGCKPGTVGIVRYVALLRGINVGGNTLIKMADLKVCVAGLGLEDVSTYIASGNVLFTTDRVATGALAERLEAAIEAHFALPVKVVVLDRPGYARIVKAIPPAWIGDGPGARTSPSCGPAGTRRRSSASSRPTPRSRTSGRSPARCCGPPGSRRSTAAWSAS